MSKDSESNHVEAKPVEKAGVQIIGGKPVSKGGVKILTNHGSSETEQK